MDETSRRGIYTLALAAFLPCFSATGREGYYLFSTKERKLHSKHHVQYLSIRILKDNLLVQYRRNCQCPKL